MSDFALVDGDSYNIDECTCRRFCELGSECIHPRVDVDLEDWGAIDKWMEGVLEKLVQLEIPVASDYLELSLPEEDTGVSRTRPFSAKMTVSPHPRNELDVECF